MGYKCPCHLEIETAKVLETYFIDLKHTILAEVLGKLKFMDLTYSTFPFGVKISTWVNQNFLLYKINCIIRRKETLDTFAVQIFTQMFPFSIFEEKFQSFLLNY